MCSSRVGPRAARVSPLSRTSVRRFPRASRLTRRADFDRVFAEGSRYKATYFTVLVAGSAEGARLGMVVGRRVSKRAVTRNRVRRQARETFRHAELPPIDVVLIGRPGLDRVTSAQLREDLNKTFGELKERCAES